MTLARVFAPRGSSGARRPVERAVVALMAMLLLAGLVVLFSATYYAAQDRGDALSAVKKQLAGIALGAIACFACAQVPHRVYRDPRLIIALLVCSVGLLALVLVPGVGVVVNGSRRWLSLAGVSFQPSELAKFAMVLYMAAALSGRGERVRRLFTGILPLLAVPGLLFLLILQQPNLSTGGSVVIVAILMVAMAGARWPHMGLLGLSGALVGAAYAWSAPYRRERLLSFRDPFAKMSDEGYQLSQSLIAFGSGGIFGQGLGAGRQKFAYLPYPESDFIFAIVGEDFGWVGSVAVILLFCTFLFVGLRVAVRCPDHHGCLLAAGVTSMIGVQAFINIGVVVGILPTTGLPLPFFSAGGTSISIMMAAVGVLLSVSRSADRFG
ncbi:MAG: putative lipid II flippase FtsW [Oscillospiraceae bacterium]|jgi:cell division protein FtsW|nr:putative lipid II flippase FtsW [Oscillospiraceae bacterium]